MRYINEPKIQSTNLDNFPILLLLDVEIVAGARNASVTLLIQQSHILVIGDCFGWRSISTVLTSGHLQKKIDESLKYIQDGPIYNPPKIHSDPFVESTHFSRGSTKKDIRGTEKSECVVDFV